MDASASLLAYIKLRLVTKNTAADAVASVRR
jgi:hypothetical protein